MADNIAVTAGSGTTIAADDIGGVLYQRVKISQGADGSGTDVSSAAPLQVSLANHAANATAVKVDGSAATQPVSIASVPSHAVTNAGTFVTQENGAALTSMQLMDDVVATLGTTTYTEATTKGNIIGAVRRDANTSLVDTTNEIAPLQLNATGELKVAQIQSLPAGSAIIGKVGIDQTTPGTTNLVALAANQSVNVAQMNGVTTTMGNGIAGTGVQRVTLASDSTGQVALAAGTNGIGKLTANSGVTIGAVEIAAAQTLATVTTVSTLTGGGIAHDGADSGNPIKIGMKAKAALSGLTLVAADDRTDAYSDLDGVQITRLNSAIGDYVSGNASNTDGSSTQVIAAGAASVKHYITDVTITNTSASNIYVELKDGTTVKWTFPVPATSGVTHHFNTPIGGTAATAWNFDPSAAATTVYCSAAAFKSKI